MRDRILVVENDPLVADLIARQSLMAAGYQAYVVSDANSAINRAIQLGPDAIIANMDLPGLSGKDLIVALSSQGVDTPVIVLARKGQESDIIQAFRLGAVDYMLWPLKEPEVINVVERVLRTGRERKEREQLARQLQRQGALELLGVDLAGLHQKLALQALGLGHHHQRFVEEIGRASCRERV